ncbi:hypothetical protein ACVWZB_004792 [Paenibacillus polymyxa]
MKHFRITRHANEGFEPKEHKTSFRFYNGLITDYDKPVEISVNDPLLTPKFSTVNACFCHFYKYTREDYKDGEIMGLRRYDRINIGYLPSDYPVFVRNRNAKGKSILQYYEMLQNPLDGSWHKFSQSMSYDIFDWVKMELSLAVKRSKEYPLRNPFNPLIPEDMSEMLLFSDDLHFLTNVRSYRRWWPVGTVALEKNIK